MIESVENKVGATTISKYDYGYNALDQRTGREQSGTAFALTGANAPSIDTFAYNSNGELVTADNNTHAALDFGFGYDGIGNRTSATDAGGTVTHTSNKLNQYTAVSGWTAAPAYDDDGNMVEAFLNGQYRLLTYNGENRLVTVEPEVAPVSGDKKIEYKYDYMGRRVSKKVSVHDGSAYNLDSHEVFVYDGWNMVAVLDAGSSYSLAKTYTWGVDLSGSMQGAGGVGGLLACEEKSGTHADTYSFTYDANGNVSQVVDSLGTIDAHYEYTPFGQVAASSGAYKEANLYKFSTKYEDTETTTLYYGFRSYDPTLGRWLNRDPIGERGGVNTYVLLNNNSIFQIDALGLQDMPLDFVTPFWENQNKYGDDPFANLYNDAKKSIEDLFTWSPPSATVCCPSGNWAGTGTVANGQFAAGIVVIWGTYLCEDAPVSVDVYGVNMSWGIAAGASLNFGVGLSSISGAYSEVDLIGKVMLDGTSWFEMSAGLGFIHGGFELSTDESWLKGGGEKVSLNSNAGLGIKGTPVSLGVVGTIDEDGPHTNNYYGLSQSAGPTGAAGFDLGFMNSAVVLIDAIIK